MKKIVLTIIAAFIGIVASAQIYVGGQASLSYNTDAESTFIAILPEAGYVLADNMAVGAVAGYQFNGVKDSYADGTLILSPYFRYTFLELGPVNVFADAQVQLSIWSNKNKILDTKDSGADFGIGVAPGIAIPLNESLSFVAHLGSFGYYGDTISFGVNANNVLCGLYYSF